MNILVVINGSLDKNDVILKHANIWSLKNNVTLICRNPEDIRHELKNIKLIDTPRSWNFRIAVWAWFKFSEHENADVIVEMPSTMPLFTAKKSKVNVAYYITRKLHGDFYKNIYFKLKIFFCTFRKRNSFYFVNNNKVFVDLSKSKIDETRIFLLKDITNAGTKLTVTKSKDSMFNNLFFIDITDSMDFEETIKVFSQIIRRDESWKLYVLSDSYDRFENTLKKYRGREDGLSNKIYFKSVRIENLQIPRNSVIIDPRKTDTAVSYIAKLAVHGFPVVMYPKANGRELRLDKIKKLVSAEESGKMGEFILEIFSDQKKLETARKNSAEWAKILSDSDGGTESLKFLEKI